MSATIVKATEPKPSAAQIASSGPPPHQTAEIESAECACCGLTEDCTPVYIARIRERYGGRWICGLCAEAVKDEIFRASRLITVDEALNRHLAFCGRFRCGSAPQDEDPAAQLIAAVRQLLRRSLDSPRLRSTPSSPRRGEEDEVRCPSLARSGSCFPSLGS